MRANRLGRTRRGASEWGSAIYQGGNRRNWGIDVPPGRYEGMTRTSRLLTCVRSVHAGSAAEVLVLTPLEAGVVTRGSRAR